MRVLTHELDKINHRLETVLCAAGEATNQIARCFHPRLATRSAALDRPTLATVVCRARRADERGEGVTRGREFSRDNRQDGSRVGGGNEGEGESLLAVSVSVEVNLAAM